MSASSAPNPEVVIIGGGLAGSAAAITLARHGVRVTLLERESHPVDKVCGEFLSEEAIDLLTALGVKLDTLAAPTITHLRVAKSNRVFTQPLPFHARSLSRRCLDEELLRIAEASGATITCGCHVIGVTRENTTWHVNLRSGEKISTTNVMLATGKHDIAGMPRPLGKQSDLVGFKQYFRLKPAQQKALTAAIELHLFPGGYAGLQLIEDGSANLCCVAKTSSLTNGTQRWPDLLAHMQQSSALLSERLDAAVACHDKPLAIAPIPYGLVRRSTSEGLWLLGDQAAVIPSFTGDGMSMALHSGALAAQAYLADETSSAFQASYANVVSKQVALATFVSQRVVRSLEQNLASAALRVAPGMLSWIASKTRLPASIRNKAMRR